MTLFKPLFMMFGVRDDEHVQVEFLFLYSFFSGLATAILYVVSVALFLSEFEFTFIPFLYIGISILSTIMIFMVSIIRNRLYWFNLQITHVLSWIAAVVVFWSILTLTPFRWPIFFIFIWYGAMASVSSVQFSDLADAFLTVPQRKRLDKLTDFAYLTGGIFGYFIIPVILSMIRIEDLLLLCMTGFVANLGVIGGISRKFKQPPVKSEPAADAEEQPEESQQTEWKVLFENKNLLKISSLAILSTFGLYFVDFLFLATTDQRYSEPEALIHFISIFFCITQIVTLVLRLTISDPLFKRHGLKFGLTILPILMAAAALLSAFFGTIKASSRFFFGMVLLDKLIDRVLRLTFEGPSNHTLYYSIPVTSRLIIKQFLSGKLRTFSIGVAGLILMMLTVVLKLSITTIAWIFAGLTVVWVIAAFRAFQAYTATLSSALQKRTLQDTSLSFDDSSSIDVLKKKIKSTYPGEVLYALDLLEKVKSESLPVVLVDLADHAEKRVRVEVLKRIANYRTTQALPVVRALLETDSDPDVRKAGLQVLAILNDAQDMDRVRAALDSPELAERAGAMIGLLRSGQPDNVLLASTRLLELVNTADASERRFAAQIIWEVGVRDLHRSLRKLLLDDDLKVRYNALLAAQTVQHPELWPLVAPNLKQSAVRTAAVSALIAGGEAVLPELEKSFDEPAQSVDVQARIMRIYGQIRGERVIELLVRRLDHPNPDVRYQVLFSLSLCNYTVKEDCIPDILHRIEHEVKYSTWLMAAFQDMEKIPLAFLLKGAIRRALDKSRRRIFLLLSFCHDANSILQARDNVTNESSERRSYALELLENMLSDEIKKLTLPILKNESPRECLEFYAKTFPQKKMELATRLPEIDKNARTWQEPWFRVSVLYTIIKVPVPQLKSMLLDALVDPHDVIRETAAWGLFHLDRHEFKKRVPDLLKDPNPQLVDVVKRLNAPGGDNEIMLTSIDRILILKSVPIFSDIPDEVLVEIAGYLQEVNVKKGETIIKVGSRDARIFLIAEGRVHVYDAHLSIASRGQGEVFGEFAALDDQPRTASVDAEEDTRLFSLNETDLKRLIQEHPEAARGIVRVLSRRIRELLDLAETHGFKKPDVRNKLQPPREQETQAHGVFLPIEKMFVLKTVSIFLETPDWVLREITSILEDVHLKAGDRLIEKGEMGNCLYIVADGKLRIHDGNKTVTFTGPRELVGEFSLLDAAPRTFSVTPVEDSHLLKLDQDVFYELMLDRPEIASGIIKVLMRYIRILIELTSPTLTEREKSA